jgi:hypothetical protein
LPYLVQDNKCAIKFAPIARSSDEDIIIRQKIAEKIAPLINHVEVEPITIFSTTRQDIIESITKNAVTNTWSDTTPR